MAYSEHARRWLAATGCAPERTFVTGSPMAEVLRANLAQIDASDVLEREGLEPRGYFLLSAHREENVDDPATGCAPERTFVTGSPMAEVLRANLAQIDASDVLEREGLEPRGYFLLSAHREENVDDPRSLQSLFSAVNAMAEEYGRPILYSCHPRSRKRLEEAGFELHPLVRTHEPLGFHDYNRLQSNAFCVVSDSGTLPEESSFFASIGRPFPAVCIRTSTERPEALDRACFVLAGIDEVGLLQAVRLAVDLEAEGSAPEAPVPDYATESVSTKVVKIIQSYTGVVDKMVWRKSL